MHGIGQGIRDEVAANCLGELTPSEMALISLVRREKAQDFSLTIRCQFGRFTVVQNAGHGREPVLGAGDSFDEAWEEAGGT